MDQSTYNPPKNQDIMQEGLNEIVELENKLRASRIPESLKEETMKSVQRLRMMFRFGGYSAEYETVSKYVDWIVRVPWGNVTEDSLDINRARKDMDLTHYGMGTIKELILDYLATMKLQNMGKVPVPQSHTRMPSQIPSRTTVDLPSSSPLSPPPPPTTFQQIPVQAKEEGGSKSVKGANTPVLLFLGLQGVGKTSIARSIANSMGRKFSRISLGGMGDVRLLRGTPKYSPNAEPGQIVKSLIRCGTMNPVILLDEIEKGSRSTGLLSDIMAILLEILDPEQNSTFVDHYIDYPIDLSKVFFICTANNLGGLSTALLDRLEVIRFTSYSDQEKEVIGREYILPSVLNELNLTSDHIQIEEEVWPLIIRPVGFDAGIRQLERNIRTMVRSAARMIVEGKPLPIVINSSNLSEYVLADQGPLS